ncbi:transporter [Leifsonia sp. RAF41]|uniref:transporter n=1 Tax=Leifsonia sp. RAF41 TaxID=3233056 RepID=UPI003F9B6CE8
MASSLPEPVKLEQDASPAQPSASTASRSRASRASLDESTVRRTATRLLPLGAALVAGCIVASLLLAVSLRTEFPLFSEASAARGRDCTTIASARHALDAALEAQLSLRVRDADAPRSIRSAIAAFGARTQDLATPSVETALSPVRRELNTLADSVQVSGATPDAPVADAAVDDAFARLAQAWQGPIARVCS